MSVGILRKGGRLGRNGRRGRFGLAHIKDWEIVKRINHK